MSGKPWPRTGQPGGQLFARAQTTLREADFRAWMKRNRQGRTECQTLALLYLVCSAARSALPLSGSKPICANTNTDASSSKSKDYYYVYFNCITMCSDASARTDSIGPCEASTIILFPFTFLNAECIYTYKKYIGENDKMSKA